MTELDPPAFYRMEDVARIATSSRSACYEDMKSGVLESIKIGGRRRVTRDQLDRYLAHLAGASTTGDAA